MQKIYLGGKYGSKVGRYALVDDDLYEELNKKRWFARKGTTTFYAVRTISTTQPKKTVRMHCLILKLDDPKLQVDHIDTNGLNNQRINLRPCTKSQNQQNRGVPRHNKSGYKGVCWYPPYEKWKAYRTEQGKHIHLGYYYTKEEAASAYNEAAKKHHGEFARLNFFKRK